MTQEPNALVVPEEIRSRIYTLPGLPPFMLAQDVAAFYEVLTKRVAEAVRRNPDRFPPDFVFRLTQRDLELLRSQNASAISAKARIEPLAFTHEGCNALSGVLKSEVAALRSVQINRAFTAMERGALLAIGAPPVSTLPETLTATEFESLLSAKVVMTGAEYLALKKDAPLALRLVAPAPADSHAPAPAGAGGAPRPPVHPIHGGGPLRRIARPVREKELRDMVALYNEGLGFRAIGRILGRNDTVVRDRIRRAAAAWGGGNLGRPLPFPPATA